MLAGEKRRRRGGAAASGKRKNERVENLTFNHI
jgi:hypothetical protein